MDERKFVKYVVGGAVALCLSAVGLDIGCTYARCKALPETTGRDTRWMLNGGCYVQSSDGKYWPEDRAVGVE